MRKFKSQITVKAVIALTAALTLSGCFQNLSGKESSSSKTTSSQTAISDVPVTPGVVNNEIQASTDQGGLIGSYRGVQSGTAGFGLLGLMVNLRAPLVNAIGETALTDLLNQVDASSSVQNINVIIDIPQFHIQARFKFAKIGKGNSKALRNVMVIRPGFTGVDFGMGIMPDQAPIQQQAAGALYTYGGLFNGSPIARLTSFVTNSTNASLPAVVNPSQTTNASWGMDFPDANNPEADPVFMRLTTTLGKIFNYTWALPTGSWSDPALDSVFSSPASLITTADSTEYLLAIHREGTTIKKAWIINPKQLGPTNILLCSSDYNNAYTNSPPAALGNTFVSFVYGHPLACDCLPMRKKNVSATGAVTYTTLRSTVYPEYCGSSQTTFSNITTNKTVPNKLAMLNAAVTARTATNSTPLMWSSATPYLDIARNIGSTADPANLIQLFPTP